MPRGKRKRKPTRRSKQIEGLTKAGAEVGLRGYKQGKNEGEEEHFSRKKKKGVRFGNEAKSMLEEYTGRCSLLPL
jgi:hypothetical protein